jgi:sugar/nucleoside kinase (ribokinase family)
VGVDTDFLILDKKVNTTLAFISVKENGEPDFTFYRNHCGADLALRQDELNEGYITGSKILHYGSISFTAEPLKSATLKALRIARGANRILSFDPNLRPTLWDSLHSAKAEIENGLQYADIVKLTDEELSFITGTSNLVRGSDMILKYGPRFVIVTRGSHSCFFNDGSNGFEASAFEVEAYDTTGAGDAFIGGLLFNLVQRIERNKSVFNLDRDEAETILRFAHACGALTVTKKGVIPALPSASEVDNFLNTKK